MIVRFDYSVKQLASSLPIESGTHTGRPSSIVLSVEDGGVLPIVTLRVQRLVQCQRYPGKRWRGISGCTGDRIISGTRRARRSGVRCIMLL